MKRLGKVKIKWSSKFAYSLGILATDGNLSPDGRHLNVTSKDAEIIVKFKKYLNLSNKIGRKSRSKSFEKKYYVIQFGDKNFYEYLVNIGIGPAKSKTLGKIKIPNNYFADFLRGCLDGDGNISITSHPESNHLQLRWRLASASKTFLDWIHIKLKEDFKIKGGWIYKGKEKSIYTLCYGKNDSIKILKLLYYKGVMCYLDRKYKLAKQFF